MVEDDGDQNISDDGEVPVYNSTNEDDDSGDDSESGNMEVDDVSAERNAVEGGRPPETHSVWKAPTTEELHQLKEATELFKSSAFKLKVNSRLYFTEDSDSNEHARSTP